MPTVSEYFNLIYSQLERVRAAQLEWLRHVNRGSRVALESSDLESEDRALIAAFQATYKALTELRGIAKVVGRVGAKGRAHRLFYSVFAPVRALGEQTQSRISIRELVIVGGGTARLEEADALWENVVQAEQDLQDLQLDFYGDWVAPTTLQIGQGRFGLRLDEHGGALGSLAWNIVEKLTGRLEPNPFGHGIREPTHYLARTVKYEILDYLRRQNGGPEEPWGWGPDNPVGPVVSGDGAAVVDSTLEIVDMFERLGEEDLLDLGPTKLINELNSDAHPAIRRQLATVLLRHYYGYTNDGIIDEWKGEDCTGADRAAKRNLLGQWNHQGRGHLQKVAHDVEPEQPEDDAEEDQNGEEN